MKTNLQDILMLLVLCVVLKMYVLVKISIKFYYLI